MINQRYISDLLLRASEIMDEDMYSKWPTKDVYIDVLRRLAGEIQARKL